MNPNLFTATATAPTFEVDQSLPGVSFTAVIRSELAKLTALRTSWWLSVVTIGLGAFIAGSVAFSYAFFQGMDDQGMLGTADAVALTTQGLTGAYLAMILLGALGVIAISTEHTTGAIRSSLAAVPQRSLLLVAKVIALAIWTAVVAAVLILISHLLMAMITQPVSIAEPFTNGDVALGYVTTWAVIVLTSLMGFGLGALLRSSAGGIVLLAVIMFVLQIVFSILWGVTDGAAWAELLMRMEYMHLVGEFTSQAPDPFGMDSMETWQAGLGVLTWVAVPLGLGWLSFARRDA